jgi:hypothetical protein
MRDGMLHSREPIGFHDRVVFPTVCRYEPLKFRFLCLLTGFVVCGTCGFNVQKETARAK